MAVRRSNIPALRQLLHDKTRAMVHEGAAAGEEAYRENVTAVTDENFPTGPFDPPHSSPGEYPERDSGQGAENIASEYPEDHVAGFGVRGERTGTARTTFNDIPDGEGQFTEVRTPRHVGGMHLIYLAEESRGDRRLGPQDTLRSTNLDQIQQRMIRAAENTNS